MNDLITWLKMGGYAQYIWSAYGIVGTVLLCNVVVIKWQKKRIRNQLKERLSGKFL